MLGRKEWWPGLRAGSGNGEKGMDLTDSSEADLMGPGTQKYRVKERKMSSLAGWMVTPWIAREEMQKGAGMWVKSNQMHTCTQREQGNTVGTF